MTNTLGVAIREINASFPALRELSLKPDPEYAGIVDDLALKLMSIISSPHLSHVTLDHTAPYSFGLADTNKWREADSTMFELRQRVGGKITFSWCFSCVEEDVERTIRRLLERVDSLGSLCILEGDGGPSPMVEDRRSYWTNVPFDV